MSKLLITASLLLLLFFLTPMFVVWVILYLAPILIFSALFGLRDF